MKGLNIQKKFSGMHAFGYIFCSVGWCFFPVSSVFFFFFGEEEDTQKKIKREKDEEYELGQNYKFFFSFSFFQFTVCLHITGVVLLMTLVLLLLLLLFDRSYCKAWRRVMNIIYNSRVYIILKFVFQIDFLLLLLLPLSFFSIWICKRIKGMVGIFIEKKKRIYT